MDDGLRISARLVIPERELRERFSRSGGPGGQHANTSDTRVELSFDVASSPSLTETARARALGRLAGRYADGLVTVVAGDQRSQLQNRQLARERLAALLAEALAPPPRARRATRPSRASVDRRIADKKRRGNVKKLRRSDPDS